MSVSRIFNKAASRLRRGAGLAYLFVMALDISGELPNYSAKTEFDFEILPPDARTVEAALEAIPPEHTSDIAERLANGHRCAVARQHGNVVYVTWAGFHTAYSYYLDRAYELSDEEVFGYSSYTVPEVRGQGIHPAVQCLLFRQFQSQGYKRSLRFIEPANRAAMRMPEKLGYTRAGVTGDVQIFGYRWYFHRDKGTFRELKKRYYWRK
jgi:L-amino acid N-acyltransferase YncA